MSAVLSTKTPSAFGRFVRIASQSAVLAAIWAVADFVARKLALPLPGGVIGLVALLALLFCGGIAPRWVKAGADWLLSDMLLFLFRRRWRRCSTAVFSWKTAGGLRWLSSAEP